MTNPQFFTLKATIYLFLLAIAIGYATSARVLEEVDPQFPFVANPTEPSDPSESDIPDVASPVDPVTTSPGGTDPPVADVVPIADPSIPLPGPVTTAATTLAPVATPVATSASGASPIATTGANVAPVATPVTTSAGGASPVSTTSATVAAVATPATTSAGGASPSATTSANVAPVETPATTSAVGTGSVASASATVAPVDLQHPPLAFFMHDILGGSHPSGRVVTGIIANSDANGLPFSKASNPVFPINGGVPLNNINSLVNNNNVPFLVGLNGSPTSTVLQNQGNNNVVNNGNNLPFVSAGQLPSGITLQQLMFGSITVVDNELTEGHELGSTVLGKGQGFYLSSSLDGSSHTIALTTLFHGDDHEHVDDTISFFGVHRTASEVSEIAVIGGTGKYEHAKGYASVETLHAGDQHTTDGVETILHFTVYLTYE